MSLQIIDICDNINKSLQNNSSYKNNNSKLIYDASGLKPRVKENNPKTIVSEVNRIKSYANDTNNKQFNPYDAAYKNMPKFSNANHNINLDFILVFKKTLKNGMQNI